MDFPHLNALWRLGGSVYKTLSNRQKAFKSIQQNTNNIDGFPAFECSLASWRFNHLVSDDAGVLDDLRPLVELGPYVGRKFLRGAGPDFEPLGKQQLLHVGGVEGAPDLGVEPVYDRPGRLHRGDDAVPVVGLEPRQPSLGDGGKLGQYDGAL